MNEPFQRITGTEVEYGFLGRSLIPENANAPLRDMLSHLPSDLRQHGQFLENGGRIYIDTGHHPEYATPECRDVLDTVESEIAGERIIASAIGALAAAKHISPKYRLHKRVLDASRNACGAHQNYLTAKEVDPDNSYVQAALAAHFVTSAVFFGAGHYDGDNWYVSQKFMVLNEVSYPTSHTDGHRPIVDTRDEPHADKDKWRRLHVTSSDANISPWAMQMKLATTSMFLHLLENGVRVDDLLLANPLEAARIVASDTTLEKTLRMADGTSMTALEIQTEIMQRVYKLSRNINLSTADLEDLEEWEDACNDALIDPELLQDRADWVQKMIISPQLAERHRGKDFKMEVRAFDQLYDLIGPKDGIGIKQRRKGVFRRKLDEDVIRDAIYTPPSNTRAWLRGSMILACAGSNKIENVNWDHVKIAGKRVMLWNNPYEDQDTRVDELLETYESSR